MKGVAPLAIVAVIAVLFLLATFGQALVPGMMATVSGVTCPEGQVAKYVYDPNVCGSTLERTNRGTAGMCLEYECPTTINGEDVAFCYTSPSVYGTQIQNCDQPGVCDKLQPGDHKYYDSYCQMERQNAGTWTLYYEVYRMRWDGCTICVDSRPDECSVGDVKCGSGAAILVCTTPSADKPYAHWQISNYCPSGSLCTGNINDVSCVIKCTSDSTCPKFQRCENNVCVDGLQCGEVCDLNRPSECETGVCRVETGWIDEVIGFEGIARCYCGGVTTYDEVKNPLEMFSIGHIIACFIVALILLVMFMVIIYLFPPLRFLQGILATPVIFMAILAVLTIMLVVLI